MPKKEVNSGKVGRPLIPLLKSEIEEAQRHTNSNRQAAKRLNVSYLRYKRYAKLYGLYDKHANPLGLGITKGFGKKPNSVPLRDIFANKYPQYSMIRLKHRMLARNLLDEKCGMCGFCERRVFDKKSPLMLTFKDTMRDFSKTNLWLLCYNCMFLTTGAPWAAHRNHIKSSLIKPDFVPSKIDVTKLSDYEEKDEDDMLENMVRADTNWQDEILNELGR
jgi:hypothetical protein